MFSFPIAESIGNSSGRVTPSETLARPLLPFLGWFWRRRLARIAEREEHRRLVIINQIAERRKAHREFKPLFGELRASTHRALAAEVGRR